jgi:hypothetical protein
MALSLSGRRTMLYWTEEGYERTELLGVLIAYLNENGWGKAVDSGWKDWDVEIYCHPWTVLQVLTAQEDHGQGKRLLRVRYRLRRRFLVNVLWCSALVAIIGAALAQTWPTALIAGLLGLLSPVVWWRGTRRAAEAVTVVDTLARRLGFLPCQPGAAGSLPAVSDAGEAEQASPPTQGTTAQGTIT